MFATWGDLLGNTTTTFTNPFPFINPPCHPSTQWLQDKHMFNDLRECKECFPAVYWQDPARCSNGFHRSPIMLFPGFAFATMLFSNLMWIHASSQFARVVKGVDLRSTAGNCAWVRTPQLTDDLIDPTTQLARECEPKIANISRTLPLFNNNASLKQHEGMSSACPLA